MIMLTRQLLSLTLLILVSTIATTLVAASIGTDPATGITFADSTTVGPLFGVGVRKKGPIKIYSVGCYGTPTLKDKLASISKTDGKGKTATTELRKGVPPASFVLKMNFKVGAEKMASAIAESVSPRHSSADDVSKLKDLIFAGVAKKGAAVKGTILQFDCSDGVEVTVDGKGQGKVESPDLAKAFCDVYLDDKCVSKALKESILDNCCAP
jgi:Chalcone isomerase-like